ncbi:MAG: golvesin C-terminal-like domain-containing protein [Planctomycetota bacterium]
MQMHRVFESSRRRLRAVCAALLFAAAARGPASAQTWGLQSYRAYPAGLVPEYLTVEDFDEDGRPDVAVGNMLGDSVTVYLGQAGGGLLESGEYPVGDRPEGLAAGDFDEDGVLDMAAACMYGNSVAILLGVAASPGVGSGAFAPGATVSFPAGAAPRAAVARDFDGDGHLDLATANYSGSSVSVLKGNGAGAFSIVQTVSVGSKPEAVAAGRFDADAAIDLVTCDTLSDRVTILKGTPAQASFSIVQAVPVGKLPRFVLATDLDGDGFDEILTADHTSDTVTILRTADGSSFSVARTLAFPLVAPSAAGPIFLAAGDLDGDGDSDLAVPLARADMLAVFPGLGGTNFGAAELQPAGDNPLGVALADLDADGDLDIALSNALDHNLYAYLKGAGAPPAVVDNGGAGTSSTGTWSLSGAAGSYGPNSVYAKAVASTAYTWTGTLSPGTYAVYAWWTQLSSRVTQVPYAVASSDPVVTAYVNQTANGGAWNALGHFRFDGAAAVQVTSTSSDRSTCADAVCFLPTLGGDGPPRLVNSGASPNPATTGETVTFEALASDPEEAIRRFEWNSSIDGFLGDAASFSRSDLSQGEHTITVRVQDAAGLWSEWKRFKLAIEAPASSLIVVDNGRPGTSSTGTWLVSGGALYYGTPSVYAKDGPTYTYAASLPAAGLYRVFAWWTVVSSRSDSVPYEIQHAAGTSTVTVDQRVLGGQWNLLGTYTFGATARVTIRAVGTASTCADAVAFELAGPPNSPPAARIDGISPNPATQGQPVEFQGSGSDPDGDPIAAYAWESSLDGALSSSASFTTSSLSAGVHTISFAVQDAKGIWSEPARETVEVRAAGGGTIVLDNGAPGTSFTGTWTVSGGANPYPPAVPGATSLYARSGPTYTYAFEVPVPGTYDVFAWWTEWPSRSASVPYDIQHFGGTATVTVNQKTNGGKWNLLGTYTFGAAARVTIRAVGSDTTCADAVALAFAETQLPPPTVFTIDDGEAGTSSVGSWAVSGGANPYGKDSLYAKNSGSYAYTFSGIPSGRYKVYAWWTTWPSRSPSVPYEIEHAGTGSPTTVSVNQLEDGGRWNLLGEFDFGTQAVVAIRVAGSTTTCADAVRLEKVTP